MVLRLSAYIHDEMGNQRFLATGNMLPERFTIVSYVPIPIISDGEFFRFDF